MLVIDLGNGYKQSVKSAPFAPMALLTAMASIAFVRSQYRNIEQMEVDNFAVNVKVGLQKKKIIRIFKDYQIKFSDRQSW